MCASNCPVHARENCEQGRACPLRRANGGERVNTAHDEPPISCDQAQRLPFYLVAAVALAALGAAASLIF